MTKLYTAQVLYIREDGTEGELVQDFTTEAAARAWLLDTDATCDQTKELWHGTRQLSFEA